MTLVGRGVEPARILEVIRTAASGTGRVLVLEGAAGIGKTVLLEEAREYAFAIGARVRTCAS